MGGGSGQVGALAPLLAFVRRRLEGAARRPVVLGLCGPQGSGKSTLAAQVRAALAAEGRRVAVISLDDYYLTRAERAALAREAHPLFATRGPPGTHDAAALTDTLRALKAGGPAALWRFDKGRDDRAPPEAFERIDAPVDLVLLEGWCVGARPEPEARLAAPVNALEAGEDPDGRWRRAVNAALAGPYQTLFHELDALALLTAPDFDTVFTWRAEQERALAASNPTAPRLMDDAALRRFLMHYERLTRWIAEEAPARADLWLPLDAGRNARSRLAATGPV